MTVVAVVLAVLVALIARDTWGWLPKISRAVIWLQTLPLPAERRVTRRREWYGELEGTYDDRRLSGLLWTLRLCPISLWERATTPISLAAVARDNFRRRDDTVRDLLYVGALIAFASASLGVPGPVTTLAVVLLWVMGVGVGVAYGGLSLRYRSAAHAAHAEARAAREYAVLQALEDFGYETTSVRLRRAARRQSAERLDEQPVTASPAPL